ncbi:MAG: putative ABC transporter permease [Lachnospiraceae bacterium]|nr:putative ABC transporter permease [Lachnospiraceae bacterium]
MGVTFYYIVSYFILFSVFGWAWESVYVSVSERRLVNRGYVAGPVCTIYGCGGLVMYFCLKLFTGNFIALFIGGMILCSVLEYVTAVVMEAIFHTSWWDYTDKKFNIKGRICLEASLLWGVAAIFEFMILVPLCDRFIGLYPENYGRTAYIVCLFLYIIDFIFSTVAAVDVAKLILKMENMLDEFVDTLKSSRIYATGEELMMRVNTIRQNIISANYIKRYSRRIEIVQAVWADNLRQLNIPESAADVAARLREAFDRFQDISRKARLKLMENRVIKAYPKIKSQKRFRELRDQTESDRKTN